MYKQIFGSAIDEVFTSEADLNARGDSLGDLRWENNKCYKCVKVRNTTATVAGAAGDAVAYEAEDGVANNTCVIDCSDADNPPVPAGLLQAAVAGVHSTQVEYFCWIQIKGPATCNTALGGSAGDGHPLYKSTTDKELAKAVEADSAAVYKTVCGVANDASAKTITCDFPF